MRRQHTAGVEFEFEFAAHNIILITHHIHGQDLTSFVRSISPFSL